MTLNSIHSISIQSGVLPRLFTALFLLIVLFGCRPEDQVKGSEFIQRDTLVKVITDIHLMDAVTNDMRFYRKFNPSDSVDLYSSIFEKYDITREMYDETIEEYSKYPKLFNKVYDEVMSNLNLMIDKLKEETEKQEDSRDNLSKPDFKEQGVL